MSKENIYEFSTYEEINKLKTTSWPNLILQYSIIDDYGIIVDRKEHDILEDKLLDQEDIIQHIGLKAYNLMKSNSMIIYVKNHSLKQTYMVCSYIFEYKEIKKLNSTDISEYWGITSKAVCNIRG